MLVVQKNLLGQLVQDVFIMGLSQIILVALYSVLEMRYVITQVAISFIFVEKMTTNRGLVYQVILKMHFVVELLIITFNYINSNFPK